MGVDVQEVTDVYSHILFICLKEDQVKTDEYVKRILGRN